MSLPLIYPIDNSVAILRVYARTPLTALLNNNRMNDIIVLSKNFKRCIRTCFILLSLLSIQAHADEDIDGRKIVDIGCHNDIATCFVTVNGAPFGATLNCLGGATNQFRFDNGDTAIGRRTFSALMTAFISGKRVSIHLVGCSNQGAPTFTWYHVYD